MELLPGLRYLLRFIPSFTWPSVAVYLALKALQSFGNVNYPGWVPLTATILAQPVVFLFQVHYSNFKHRRHAAVLGAVRPPAVKDTALDIVVISAKAHKIGYPAEMLHDWSMKYGNSFRFNMFTSHFFATLEPEHAKAILATQFESFEKGSMFRSQADSLLGSGVFNTDGKFRLLVFFPTKLIFVWSPGDMWKFHRSMTRPFFTRERISDFEIYERNCHLSLNQARDRLSEGYPVEFQDLVSRFTLDSASEFLFCQSVGSLSAGISYPPSAARENPISFYNHPSRVFAQAFTDAQLRLALRLGVGNEWLLTEFFGDKIQPLRKVMDDFTEPLMKAALEKRERDLQEKVDEKTEEPNLLAHLVKHTQDEKILKDELVNLLVAGRDTTMTLLTFSMYMLTQHPDIEHRLRQEVFEKVGLTAAPTYESMREMKYVRAFLNEVLRLYPPVYDAAPLFYLFPFEFTFDDRPADSRVTNKAVVLPSKQPGQSPLYIPEDTSCIYSVLHMHRRTDLWGPDALKFDPDRFLDERLHKYLTPNPFIFCPFNAGPRICLGQQFAYHEATFYLVRLLQNFKDFKLDETANVKPPAEWKDRNARISGEKIRLTAHLTFQRVGYPGDILQDWSKEYGPAYRLNLFTTTAAILTSQFDSFEKGPLLASQLRSLIGEGVFNSDGELWKCDLVSRFALDVSTVYLMGHDVESTSVGLPYPPSEAHRNPPAHYTHPSTALTDALAEAQEITNSRVAYGAEWPLAEFWGDAVKPYKKIIDDVVEPFVRRALEKRQMEQEGKESADPGGMTFLEHLVTHVQDPVLLKDELINMLLAGRDTTMSFLTFAVYMLTQHPEVERRLRQEISEVVGMLNTRPTDEMIRDLQYMRAFLNEILRLYPSVMAKTDTIFPACREGEQPIFVPKGTTCIYHVINMHRRTDLWGPDALTFDPDRFLDERYQKYLAPNPYIFCPFNAGPRICIGQQLAYNEASFFLVRLLQSFTGFTLDEKVTKKPPTEWASCEGRKGTDKIRFTSHLTIAQQKGGLWIRMTALEDSEDEDDTERHC
ncbi:hypothetical protein NLJ89_g4237 [Agrocybe chaxingu]|uniref:Cytochrome P450 n=1 Tax=Agrocybe chaxingu TaxID=84603 RepID=A0A9W8MXV5_9AGAR|nr:hypothetical protein NLJ89_g4237 [Agrocybe chaxingu]